MAPGFPLFWQPDRRGAVLAGEIEHHLQCPPIKPFELLSLSLVGEPVEHRLSVSLAPPRQDPRFAEVEVELQLFAWALPGGAWVGVVPAWGVECSASSEEELINRTRNELAMLAPRQRRWRDPVKLVELLMVRKVELSPHMIEIDYNRQRVKKQEDLLAEVTSPMPEARFNSGGRTSPETRVFGLDDRFRQLRQVLDKRSPQSVLLVGPSGSGKTALVRAFSCDPSVEVREADGGEMLMRLMSDSGWQEPMHRMLEQLLEPGAPMLFVRNLAKLFEVGRYIGNRISLAEFMVPYLNRGLTLISECTPEQHALLDARYPGVLNAVFPLDLPEHTPEKLDEIVRQKAKALGKRGKVCFESGAVETVMKLHRRFSPYSGMPGRPLRFVETLLRRLDREGNQDQRSLSMADMHKAFSAASGIPLALLDPEEPLPADDIEAFFRRRVFGQDEVCATLVRTLTTIKAGMSRAGKPVASLLFIGPTGVGKTEMCKALAEFVFSDSGRINRFDMSEYQDVQALARLCGLPGEDGVLTGAVRQQPFGVILLDEVEKAHPDFFDLLLPMLGEGRLTDGHGRVADFCSSIVVMTSNLGADALARRGVGFTAGDSDERDLRAHYHEVVRRHLRPEMFNRLDEILFFRPLDREVMLKLIDRELTELGRRPGFKQSQPTVTIDQSLRDRLVEAGYDPRYGARHLKRAVRELISVPVSAAILSSCHADPLAAVAIESAAGSKQQPAVKLEARAAEKDRVSWESLEKTVSAHRRDLVAMMDAHAWFLIQSWIDEERELRQKHMKANKERGKKSYVEHSARYRKLIQIREEFLTLRQQICRMEEDLLDVLIMREDSKLADQDIDQFRSQLENWRQSWLSQRNRIFCTVEEIGDQTTVGLFCARAYESELLKKYIAHYEKAAADLDLKYSCNAISRSEGQGKIYRAEFQNGELDSQALGVEIRFTEPMAYVYFQPEHGAHEDIVGQFGSDRRRTYLWVDVANAAPAADLPGGIHRWGSRRLDTHGVRKIEGGMVKIKTQSGTTTERFVDLELSRLMIQQAETTIRKVLWD